MTEPVVAISELTRRFGAKTALASVSLSLERGTVYGLVGANGAGKTTLIRHILGLLRAQQGSVRVFGMDPVTEPVARISTFSPAVTFPVTAPMMTTAFAEISALMSACGPMVSV